jgi:hypothetical protein
MKKLILALTAAVGLLASTAHAQYTLQSWGLTYTNIGVWTNAGNASVTNNCATNTVSQATNDFWTFGLEPVTLLASCYSTNMDVSADNQAVAAFVFVPSPDKLTWYSDEYNTNNQRLNISLSNSNTTYAWMTFDPGPFRYWKLAAFEKPSTNLLVTNITLKIYKAK